MTEQQANLIIRTALNSLSNGPRSVEKAVVNAADLEECTLGVGDLELLLASVVGDDPNAEARLKFERALHEWDNVENGDWTEGTDRNTAERRQVIYQRLRISTDLSARADNLIPVHQLGSPTIIALDHKEWFTEERKQKRQFYWPALKEYLASRQKWPVESVSELDNATDAIVGRLSDPERMEAYQTKGLVVGYVQSGKTANFTGVIAKAADAGYRLIIVLAGTLDVLRSQTQRRVDKDMIGRELLDRDYVADSDWDKFLSHGAKPSDLGAFDWYRLTGPESDYKKLARGVEALQFEAADPTKPLWNK